MPNISVDILIPPFILAEATTELDRLVDAAIEEHDQTRRVAALEQEDHYEFKVALTEDEIQEELKNPGTWRVENMIKTASGGG